MLLEKRKRALKKSVHRCISFYDKRQESVAANCAAAVWQHFPNAAEAFRIGNCNPCLVMVLAVRGSERDKPRQQGFIEE